MTIDEILYINIEQKLMCFELWVKREPISLLCGHVNLQFTSKATACVKQTLGAHAKSDLYKQNSDNLRCIQTFSLFPANIRYMS